MVKNNKCQPYPLMEGKQATNMNPIVAGEYNSPYCFKLFVNSWLNSWREISICMPAQPFSNQAVKTKKSPSPFKIPLSYCRNILFILGKSLYDK
jgi:hypothetical protein